MMINLTALKAVFKNWLTMFHLFAALMNLLAVATAHPESDMIPWNTGFFFFSFTMFVFTAIGVYTEAESKISYEEAALWDEPWPRETTVTKPVETVVTPAEPEVKTQKYCTVKE